MTNNIRIRRLATLGLVIIVGLSFAVSSAVSATTKKQTCQTLKNGAIVCNIQNVASTDSLGSFHVTSLTKITVSGDTVLRYQTVNGYATSAKCYREPSFTDVPKGATCWIATKLGYRFKNSGVSTSGIRVYFEDYIGSKYSPVGTKFYWDEQLRTWRKANCGNYVSFIGTEKLTVAHVELVQTFNQLAVSLTGQVQKTLSEEIEAKATCNINGTSASASIYGSDTLRLWIKVQAKASSYELAVGLAEASAIKKSDSLNAGLSAEVNAQAFDNLYGKVSVRCHTSVTETTTTSPPAKTTTTTTPPRTTTTTTAPPSTTTTTTAPPRTTTTTTTTTTMPPPTTTTSTTTTTTQPPTPLLIYNLSQPQEVTAGGSDYSYNFHASVQYQKGDTVSVGFQVYGGNDYTVVNASLYGSFPPNGAYYDTTDGYWHDVYTPPDQVPTDNNGDVEVVATITDQTTGLSASTNVFFQLQPTTTFLVAHNIVHAAS